MQARSAYADTVCVVVDESAGGLSAAIFTSTPASIPKFATLPSELIDEIFSYFTVLPLIWYQDTSLGGYPNTSYFERTKTLRIVASTCRAMRLVALPRLWSRIDACYVPERSRGTWYKYVMEQLKRKATGVENMDEGIRDYVRRAVFLISVFKPPLTIRHTLRTLAFMVTKADIKSTVAYLPRLLVSLRSLHTIHILSLRVTRDFKAAVSNLTLPSVRTLVIPTDANQLVKACPNVTHVRCSCGDGSALIAALKDSKCTTLDGMIDWVRDPRLTTRTFLLERLVPVVVA